MLFVLNISNAAAANGEKASSEQAAESRDNKQSNGQTDETQKQYIVRLRQLNAELRNRHIAFTQNYRRMISTYDRMNSSLQWDYGNIPSHILRSIEDLAAERGRIETKIKELEKEKDDLYAGALSSYNGKMPLWLSQQWAEEAKKYLDYVDQIYLELQWALLERTWIGEEKKYLDMMLEYYRLRRKEPDATSPQLR